jgi:hypothetical protein
MADPTGTGAHRANLANKCARRIVYPGGARERILGGLGTLFRRDEVLSHTRGDRLPEHAETNDATLWGRAAAAVRRGRRGIVYAIAAIVASFALGAASIVGWQYYTESRIGRVELLTEDEPVVAQVLAESSDTPIGEPFDLVTRAVVSLPEGDYRLRVNGVGRIGRTYRFAVNRGETQSHTISINEGRLRGGEQSNVAVSGPHARAAAIPFARVLGAREILAGKADFIQFDGKVLIRRDGATGKVIWDAFHPRKPFASDRDPVRWMGNAFYPAPPGGLLEQVPDLDGDGVGDLVLFNDNAPAVLALSGKDGSMIWNYVAELNGPGGPRDVCPKDRVAQHDGAFAAGGLAMIDVDRDGTLDVCATFDFEQSIPVPNEDAESSQALVQMDVWRHRSIIVALSGRSGRCVWTHPVEPDFVESKSEHDDWPAELVRGRRSTVLAFVAKTQWMGLDPVTGRVQAGPIELGFMPARPVVHADLDGDGEPEIVTTEPGPASREQTLRVWSIEGGRELWSQTIDAAYASWDGTNGMRDDPPVAPPPSCPLIADLDRDGRTEIVVPDAGPMPPLAGYRGVRLLDGRTGATRWRRALRPESTEEDGVSEIIAAPDLDGDGTRDVVTISLLVTPDAPARIRQRQRPEPVRIWGDALSGKDGHPLWWWNVDTPMDKPARIWTPFWWGRGPDGWPLLAIPLGGSEDSSPGSQQDSTMREAVYLLEASTGRERHAINGLARANLADLDGDGLPDLWGNVGGGLRAFRGEGAEVWRALGSLQPALSWPYRWEAPSTLVIDLDGDGIADALDAEVQAPSDWSGDGSGSHTALARSGRDGHVIWKIALDPWGSWLRPGGGEDYSLAACPSPAGDLDGDGTPDVIVIKSGTESDNLAAMRAATLPVQVFSGRTGTRLWASGSLPPGVRSQGERALWAVPRKVEPNGRPDLIVCHRSSYVTPGLKVSAGAAGAGGDRLARLSGRDGRVLWDVSLLHTNSAVFLEVASCDDFDFNGDGGLDIVLGPPPNSHVIAGSQPILIAISLRDGKRLWSRPLMNDSGFVYQTEVSGSDDPGRQTVVVTEGLDRGDRADLRICGYEGESGQPRWNTRPNTMPAIGPSPAFMVMTDFDGNKRKFSCVSFREPGGARRIVVLGPNGEERARRDFKRDDGRGPLAADINGDGRDELLAWGDGGLHALDRELKDVWARPIPPEMTGVAFAGSWGRGRELMISPALELDAATGRPRWTGQAPLVPEQFEPYLLDPGDATRMPLLITAGLEATVCRLAMETTSEGRIAEPRGTVVRAGQAPEDPRWRRPLPWVSRLNGAFGPWGLLAAMGLAAVSVFVPVLIVRLARGRRRNYTIRALMSVPVAVAVPLVVYLTLVPRLPPSESPLLATDGRMFVTGTLAGVPMVACVIWIGASVRRRRWRGLIGLVVVAVMATIAVAGGWIWVDRKEMATVEHYGWEGWELVLLAGAYVAAVIWGVVKVVVRVYGWGISAGRARD